MYNKCQHHQLNKKLLYKIYSNGLWYDIVIIIACNDSFALFKVDIIILTLSFFEQMNVLFQFIYPS